MTALHSTWSSAEIRKGLGYSQLSSLNFKELKKSNKKSLPKKKPYPKSSSTKK